VVLIDVVLTTRNRSRRGKDSNPLNYIKGIVEDSGADDFRIVTNGISTKDNRITFLKRIHGAFATRSIRSIEFLLIYENVFTVQSDYGFSFRGDKDIFFDLLDKFPQFNRITYEILLTDFETEDNDLEAWNKIHMERSNGDIVSYE